MRKLIIRLIILLCFLANITAVAAKLKARVDRTDIAMGQSLNLTITVEDFKLKDLNFPFDTIDYQVVSNSSSTSFQIINGASSQSKSYTFTIIPKHPGTITLPAATMNDGTNVFSSEPISINVRPTAASNPNPGTAPQQAIPPHNSAARSGNTPKVYKENILARLETNTLNPYKNQQVNVKLKIYHRGNLRTIQIPPLNLDSFIVRKDNTAREYQANYNGMDYLVYELNFIVFPIKSGNLTIDGHEIQAVIVEDAGIGNNMFDPFNILNPFLVDRQTKLKTNSLSFNVRELPAGAPKDFTGYVGELAVNNEINSYTIKAGDAISLKTKIYGTGNPKNLKCDNLKSSKLFSAFKDNEKNNEQIENAKQYFENVVSTAIVPNKTSGKIAIELKPLISFNPATGKYEEHGQERFEISIQGGTPGTTSAGNGEEALVEEEPEEPELETVQEILSVSQTEIDNYKKSPLENTQGLFIILLAINLLALLIKIIEKLSGFNFKTILSDEYSEASKSIKRSENIAEVSKILRDLLTKSKANEQEAIKDDIEIFFNESDQVNYGFNPNSLNSNGQQERLDYFKTKALDIIKKTKGTVKS